MPLSTLNKIIALFIVGALFLLWLAIVFWETLSDFALDYRNLGNPGGAVALGLLLLALSALAGVMIEGITDLTVRRLIQFSFRKPGWARFVGQRSIQESMRYWEDAFKEKAERNSFYKRVLKAYPNASKDLAAGFLFRNAPKEHVDWVVSHYATYYLATNFLVILLLFGTLGFALFISASKHLAIIVTSVCLPGAIYPTWSLAVDRYLYTYETAFRFAALTMDSDKNLRTETPKDLDCVAVSSAADVS